MNKLLSANFARLWRDKVFWIGVAIMAIFAIFYVVNSAIKAGYLGIVAPLEAYYFFYGPFIGFYCAIFTTLFLGKEYEDGVIRNKLIVGRRRYEIYTANLLTVFTATIIVMAAWWIGALAGIPIIGAWEMGAMDLLAYLSISVLFVAAFSAIFTTVAMLCTNRALTVVLSMLLFFGLLFGGALIDNRRAEPETISRFVGTMPVVFDVDFEIADLDDKIEAMMETIPNPRYLTGYKRQVYDLLEDFLPSIQSINISFGRVTHPLRMMLSSVFIMFVVTVAGIYVFNGKDIR